MIGVEFRFGPYYYVRLNLIKKSLEVATLVTTLNSVDIYIDNS